MITIFGELKDTGIWNVILLLKIISTYLFLYSNNTQKKMLMQA